MGRFWQLKVSLKGILLLIGVACVNLVEIHLSVGHYTAILHSSERLVLTWFFLSLFKCYWNRVYGRHRSYLIGNAILLCIMWIIWCEREFILLRGMSFLWRSWKRYSLRCLHEWTVMGSLPSFSFPDCWFVKLSSVLFKKIFLYIHIFLYDWDHFTPFS